MLACELTSVQKKARAIWETASSSSLRMQTAMLAMCPLTFITSPRMRWLSTARQRLRTAAEEEEEEERKGERTEGGGGKGGEG
jgi:hypothetical protein